jgi:hypothetical protein
MPKNDKPVAKTSTSGLRLLWGKGVFKNWQNSPQIVDRLAQDEYHFSSPEFLMALKRAKYLTRRGNRRSYEYIQKYPFTKDDES